MPVSHAWLACISYEWACSVSTSAHGQQSSPFFPLLFCSPLWSCSQDKDDLRLPPRVGGRQQQAVQSPDRTYSGQGEDMYVTHGNTFGFLREGSRTLSGGRARIRPHTNVHDPHLALDTYTSSRPRYPFWEPTMSVPIPSDLCCPSPLLSIAFILDHPDVE